MAKTKTQCPVGRAMKAAGFKMAPQKAELKRGHGMAPQKVELRRGKR